MNHDSIKNKYSDKTDSFDQFLMPELPSETVRIKSDTHSYESISFTLPDNLSELIYSYHSNLKLPVNTLLLCALSIILSRYCRQYHLIITKGSFLQVNNSAEIRFSNHKINIDESLTFRDCCTAILNSETSPCYCTKIVYKKSSGSLPDSIQKPLSPVIFFSSETFDHDSLKQCASILNSEVIFSVCNTGSTLTCSVVFDNHLFHSDFINRFTAHFQCTLSNCLSDKNALISDIEIMSGDELNMIISSWNSTEYTIHDSRSLSELFDLQVHMHPDATALITENCSIDFKSLSDRVNCLANALINKGIHAQLPVAVCMDRSIELITSIIAIVKAGGTYVPLDPSYPIAHVNLILNDCTPALVLTDETYKALFVKSDSEVLFVDDSFFAKNHCIKPVENSPIDPDTRFYIMYTSGSSGKPKGVEGIYRGILDRLYWMWDVFPYTDSDICCSRTPAGFVDHIAEILAPLCKGVPIVIADGRSTSSAFNFAQLMIKYKISRILMVPSLLQSLLHCDTEILLNLTDLRYVFSSGETLGSSLVRLFYQHIRNARLVNIYGSTEVSADATYYEVKRFFAGDVLKYFTQSIDLPGGLKETIIDGYNNPIKSDRITSENVPVEVIAGRFHSSQIADYPLAPEQYFKKLYTDVFPYVINTAAPTFIGHMTSALPDFVHDISKLISQLNQNLVKIETAKSLIFLERETLAILHRCFYNMSNSFYDQYVQKLNSNLGLVTTGGTTANITALLTARNKALFPTYSDFASSGKSIYRILREKGYEDMTILGTHRMHYSIRKAISVLGLGIDNIMYVETDDQGRLDTRDLEDKINMCQSRKILVLAIIGIAGATETGQIDPLDDIGQIAQTYGIHFHVDAAWGGTTIFSERYKSKLDGIERADSITFCGHKQLYLPQGISICLFRDPDQLQFAATTASYQAAADSYDVGRFTLEGSRSAISLCLHAALQLIGKKGYESLVNYSMDLTSFFVRTILSSTAFELIGTPDLNIVNYRYVPLRFRDRALQHTLSSDDNIEINDFNRIMQQRQFLKGKTFVSKTTLTHTRYALKEIVVFRAVLSNPLTTYADLYLVLEDQLSIAHEISSLEKCAKLGDHYQITVLHENERMFQDNPTTPESDEKTIPIGKPLYNSTAYILDNMLRICPIGIPGELYIGGAIVARGYFNNKTLTDDVFIKSPFKAQDRLFKTGDRARYLSDGSIEFMGRLDDQLKINGYRIEPSEVEFHISQIDSVCHCKVAALTEKNGYKKLTAWLVLKPGSSSEEIKTSLTGKLPEYMIPTSYHVIDKMPLLPNGKIDKSALQKL